MRLLTEHANQRRRLIDDTSRVHVGEQMEEEEVEEEESDAGTRIWRMV